MRRRPQARLVGALTAFAAAFSVGCAPPPVDGDAPNDPLVEVRLADAMSWRLADAEADLFAEHRPQEVVCADAGWRVEDDAFEVATGECAYLVVEQPLLHPVPKGGVVTVTLWHQSLYAEEEAMGHAALSVGGTLLWEREVPIPSPADVYVDDVIAERNLAEGESLVFHLHNHGANTWNLASVALNDPSDVEGAL